MSGLGGLAIVLVMVVWLFVLAPFLLRGQERIRQTSIGFDKTRVLYQGNSGSVPSSRRANILATARKLSSKSEDTAKDDGLVEDEEVPPASGSQAKAGSVQDKEQQVIDAELVEDKGNRSEVPASEKASQGLDYSVLESSALANISIAGVSSTVHEFDEADADAYLQPEDLLYRDPQQSYPEVHISDSREDSSEEDLTSGMDQLTAEEIAFAQSRSQRGSWDPEVERVKTATTYQRRQRTLLALMGALLVAVVVGFMLNNWAWLASGVVLVVTAIYLVALRTQVRQEENLRQRRIHQLRRRMNGVLNVEDEELHIERQYYYPGANVVQRDDEDVDFEDIPLYDAPHADHADEGLLVSAQRAS